MQQSAPKGYVTNGRHSVSQETGHRTSLDALAAGLDPLTAVRLSVTFHYGDVPGRLGRVLHNAFNGGRGIGRVFDVVDRLFPTREAADGYCVNHGYTVPFRWNTRCDLCGSRPGPGNLTARPAVLPRLHYRHLPRWFDIAESAVRVCDHCLQHGDFAESPWYARQAVQA